MKFTTSKPLLPDFQITPMLDVVFLLLCFFVTTSVFSQWENEVNIQLPTADTATVPERLPGEIIINIDAKGDIFVNQNQLTAEELGSRCKVLATNFPGQPVLIRADKATPYEFVLKVVDTCSKSDIWNLSFATEMTDSSKASDVPPAAIR